MDITISNFMEGRYDLTIYVGIDIAKLNHFVAVIPSDSEILIESFRFSNNYDGSYLLLSRLVSLDQNDIIISLKSTTHYDDNFVRFLTNKDLKVCVFNPIQTLFMRENNVHKTETNKVGALMIAKTPMMQDSLRSVALGDLDYIELKELGRFRQELVKQRTRLKIQLTSYVDQAFPELQYFLKSGLYQDSVYAVLKEVPTPSITASMHLTHPAHTLEVVSHGRFGEDKVRESRALMQRSVGVNDSSLSTQIIHIIEQIELPDSRSFSIEFEIVNPVARLYFVIITIPGTGVVGGGMIPGEIGDIHQFSNPKKPFVLAGPDPTVYQSGNFQAYRARASKRGSRVLRYTFINAIYNVVKNSATFKAHYDTKRAEG